MGRPRSNSDGGGAFSNRHTPFGLGCYHKQVQETALFGPSFRLFLWSVFTSELIPVLVVYVVSVGMVVVVVVCCALFVGMWLLLCVV